MTFRYKKSIDRRVKPAIEKVLSVKVGRISKIKSGEVNHVYKVETTKKPLLVRVFRYDDWPENGKLEWIDRQFAKRHIPRAKLLFYSRNGRWFPNGFMVSEYVEGKTAADAIKANELSTANYYKHVAKLLRKIHRIKLKKFGDWHHNRLGTHPSLISFLLPRFAGKFKQLERTKYYHKDTHKKVEAKIIQLLKPLERKLKPVLTHGDPGRDNCIWTKNRKLILVDWDNARSSAWFRDYADLMYWESYAVQFGSAPKTRAMNAKTSFLKGYGETGLTRNEVDRITSAFFIVQAVNLLPYYYFDQRNMVAFHNTRRTLRDLLKC